MKYIVLLAFLCAGCVPYRPDQPIPAGGELPGDGPDPRVFAPEARIR